MSDSSQIHREHNEQIIIHRENPVVRAGGRDLVNTVPAGETLDWNLQVDKHQRIRKSRHHHQHQVYTKTVAGFSLSRHVWCEPYNKTIISLVEFMLWHVSACVSHWDLLCVKFRRFPFNVKVSLILILWRPAGNTHCDHIHTQLKEAWTQPQKHKDTGQDWFKTSLWFSRWSVSDLWSVLNFRKLMNHCVTTSQSSQWTTTSACCKEQLNTIFSVLYKPNTTVRCSDYDPSTGGSQDVHRGKQLLVSCFNQVGDCPTLSYDAQ